MHDIAFKCTTQTRVAKEERTCVKDERKNGSNDSWDKNEQKVVIDNWGAETKRQGDWTCSSNVFVRRAMLAKGYKDKENITDQQGAGGGRGGRKRGQRGVKEIKSNRGDHGSKQVMVKVYLRRRSRKWRERGRCADLYWTCKLNWVEHKIHITCQITTSVTVCVWECVCVGGSSCWCARVGGWVCDVF